MCNLSVTDYTLGVTKPDLIGADLSDQGDKDSVSPLSPTPPHREEPRQHHADILRYARREPFLYVERLPVINGICRECRK